MSFIKYVKLKNFYNYFGETVFDFKEGINIVVADNNGGKSKLYNAFLWTISDKVFDSDLRTYQSLENNKDIFKLISDKAKFKSKLGDVIETSVELRFITDLDKPNYGPTEYKIIKIIKAEKIAENNCYLDTDWKISPIDCYCERTQNSKTFQIKSFNDQKKISEKLLPIPLQKYFMFQGEEVDNLVNGKELTNAMRQITELWMFDYFEEYLKDIKNNAENKKNINLKKNAKNKEKAEILSNSIDDLKVIIEKSTKEVKNYKEDEEEKNNKLNLLESKLFEYNKQNENLIKRIKVEQKLEEVTNKVKNFEKLYNNNFFTNKWILEGFDKKINIFNELRDDYQQCVHEEKIIDESYVKNTLPQGTPDISSLKLMLDKNECLVCGRDAKKNSKEYNHIKKLYDNNLSIKNKKQKVPVIRSFIDDLFKSSSNIPKAEIIKELKEKKAEEYKNMKANVEELSEELEKIKKEEVFEKDKIDKFLNEHQQCKAQVNKLRAKLLNEGKNLERAQKELNKKQNDLDSLSTEENKIDHEKVEVLLDLNEVFINTKSRYYSELAKELGENINNIYQSLTRGNETNPGVVSVYVNDNYHFLSELLNNEGGLLSGQGAAFQRMRQLAIVMGILKMDNQSSYPIIADAPISEMGEVLAHNFFYQISSSFKQSIILVKDLYTQDNGIGKINSFGEELITDQYLNPKVYLNRALGKNQQERETKIMLIHEGEN